MILALLVAVGAGILLNALSFTANAGIVWVVLRNKTLRKAPTSVFLLNLCLSDLSIALLLIPVAITILISALLEDNGILVPTYVCGPISFIHSLLVYSGAWAAAAISVDRRFSIVAPMAHAAFMTTRRALLAVAMVWTTAAAFALLPHIFPSNNSNLLFNATNSYTTTAMYISLVSSSSSSSSVASLLSNSTSHSAILKNLSSATVNASSSASSLYLMSVNTSMSASTFLGYRNECHMWKSCALMFALDWSDKSHVFAVAVGCYLIPTLIMISMYLSIFKVARKAGLQVHPTNPPAIPTISKELEERDEAEKRAEETKDDVDDAPHVNENETEGRIIEMNVHALVPESTEGDPPEDMQTKMETEPRSGKSCEISLETESDRNCRFRHLFSNEEKNEGATPPYQLDGGVPSGDPSKDLACPECSSKSCLTRWRSGSKISLECGSSDTSGSKTSASTGVAGGKARRTLLLILGFSLASWTPYYLVHAYCSCTNDCWNDLPVSKFSCPKHNGSPAHLIPGNAITPFPRLEISPASCNVSCTSGVFPVSFLMYRRSYVVSVVVWLLFLSSAINPILYGLLNRPVREQVILRASAISAFCTYLFCRYFCRLCDDHGNPGGTDVNQGREEEEDGVEDFLQFLERTSSLSDAPTSRSSILHSDKV